MRQALDTIAEIASGGQLGVFDLPWGTLRYQHATLIKSALSERYAPATVISALPGVIGAAWRLGQIDAEEYHRIADIKGVKNETLPAGRSIHPGELSGLLETCARDGSPAGTRDGAIIAALYGGGLRRAKIVGLDLADYDQVAGTLRVRGKGRKERLVPIVNGVAAALADWLAVRGEELRPLVEIEENLSAGG
jgi:site-specific recombinase XerC